MSLTTTNKRTKTPKHKNNSEHGTSFAQNMAVASHSIQSKSQSLYHVCKGLGSLIIFRRVDWSSIPIQGGLFLSFLAGPFRPSCCSSNVVVPHLMDLAFTLSLCLECEYIHFLQTLAHESPTPWGFHWPPPFIWNCSRMSNSSTQSPEPCSCKFFSNTYHPLTCPFLSSLFLSLSPFFCFLRVFISHQNLKLMRVKYLSLFFLLMYNIFRTNYHLVVLFYVPETQLKAILTLFISFNPH